MRHIRLPHTPGFPVSPTRHGGERFGPRRRRAGHPRSGGHETLVTCTVELPEEDDHYGASDARTNPGICRSQKRRAVNSSTGRLRPGAGAQQPSARSRLSRPTCSSTTASVSHIGRAMRFELRTVWPATHGGDRALVDDVDNQFFGDFVREVSEPPSIVTRPADGTYMFGAMRKARPADHSGGLSTAASPPRIVSAPGRSTKGGSLPPTRPDHG